jgi:hypothetical protein
MIEKTSALGLPAAVPWCDLEQPEESGKGQEEEVAHDV